MTRLGRIAKLAGVPLVTIGLAACSGSNMFGGGADLTTQSVQATEPAKVAEPDCGALKAEIDKLNATDIQGKLQKAAAKKYNPTQDEWAQFPRYNNLVETYGVKKCEPSLQQANGAKPKAKSATAPIKVSSVMPAKAKTAVTESAGKSAVTAAAPGQTPVMAAEAAQTGAQQSVEGVTIKIPKQ